MISDTKNESRAVIFTGGRCEWELLIPDELCSPLIIAADAGWLTAKKCGVKPHLIVGDFDSSPIPQADEATEIRRVPTEKDDTDTMLACKIAIEQGFREILVIGGTGGRLDHTLSNIFLLETMYKNGTRVTLTDGTNRARLIKDETVHLPSARFRYFSLFSLGTSTATLAGCKYPLADAPLSRTDLYAVSNEITAGAASVTVSGDAILLIESDAHSC